MGTKEEINLSIHSQKYLDVITEFNEKRKNKEMLIQSREKELSKSNEEMRVLNKEISLLPSRILHEITLGGEDLEERIKSLISNKQTLSKKRNAILKKLGYPENYLDLTFDCNICDDTGYVGQEMCTCFKKALAKARYSESGLEKLILKQNFENFSLSYYTDENKENMKNTLKEAKKFAKNFSKENMSNILYMGMTGLGKTHLSTSIAKVVMDNGYDVIYETAQNIFTDIETDRFNRTERDSSEFISSKYYDCDLLIIDDLGTEIDNKYNISAMYHLINSRLVNDKSTIINTNLSIDDFRDRYEDRITSRIVGEYKIYLFKGTDVRYQKVKNLYK